jgi:Fur family transcriptional regulator, peroxide stress response regulator
LATIYKTIALLKDVQEILEIRFSESSRFDGNKHYPHSQIICLKCNKIVDPELMGLEKFTEEAAARTGFRITPIVWIFSASALSARPKNNII